MLSEIALLIEETVVRHGYLGALTEECGVGAYGRSVLTPEVVAYFTQLVEAGIVALV